MKKTILSLIMAAILVLSLFGGAIAEKGTPVIAFVPKITNQPWWERAISGVQQWSKDFGIDVIIKGPTELDPAAQVQIITDLVNQGVDILCVAPLDPASCENILKQAREKGIIVIAHESVGIVNADYDLEAFSEAGLGGAMMDNLAKMMGEEGEYITMAGFVTMASHMNWINAAVARQKEAYPKMVLVDPVPVESECDAERAYELTKELLKKYPNLKGIQGTSSFDCLGVARAIEEMGLIGKFFVTSVGLPAENGEFLDHGSLQVISLWDPYWSNYLMQTVGLKMWNGEEIKTGLDLGIDGYHNCTVQGNVIMGQGWLQITKDNWKIFGF
jgi:simple sugar transport system substrate-binding protein